MRRVLHLVFLALFEALAACGGSGNPSPPPPPPLACTGSAPALPGRLTVGYAGDVAVVGSTGFDLRYQYLAGVLAPDPACLAPGRPKAIGCGTAWWGTWQWDELPPGKFVRDFVAASAAAGLRPTFTYYLILPAAQDRLGIAEGTAEATVAARDLAFMTAYLDDFRFFLRQVGAAPAIVHLEPDFWAYAQHAARAAGTDAHGLPASVASANPTDCGAAEESIAGLGRCMVSMVRTYAPNALVGLHGSAWASGPDCISNTSTSLDVAAEGRKTADFLLAAGAGCADLVVVDISDRDAGWYQRQNPPRNSWLDATDTTLPTFTQAFTWSRAVADRAGKKLLWWQVPVGNMALPNACDAQGNGTNQDNKLDYFFDHPDRVAASGAAGMAFGAGARCQTTPENDGGNLKARAAALAAAGGQPLLHVQPRWTMATPPSTSSPPATVVAPMVSPSSRTAAATVTSGSR